MMFRKRLTFVPLLGVVLLPLFIGRPAVSEPSPKLLAVLEFKGANLKADILDTMSDAVRGGASDALTSTGTNVMTRESMLVLLKEMGIKECTEGDCEVETARNIGADYVISGRIVQMDGSYVATLKLHETKRGTLLGTRDAEAKKQKDLWHALKELGRKLVAEKLVARPNPPAVPASAPSSPIVVLPAPPLPAVSPAPQPTGSCAANQISIPGGTFWMGDSDENPVHKVTLSPYCIDKTEVTVAAYRACIQSGECQPATSNSSLCNWGEAWKDRHPINCVDWNEARAYCEWTGGRLPTEVEWEFAARGLDGRKYPWGNEAPASQLCWGGEGNDLGRGNRQGTCPVGRYPSGASPFGVLDMAGNVREWTEDSYAPYSAEAERAPLRSRPNVSLFVNRGGSWGNRSPSWVRAANRDRVETGVRINDLGFRCARGAKM
jgi:formylglycine-generating enzyme required for sulfatase activity